jgi:hypothetical protein
MKLFYTLAFALFPLTAPAQAPDASLLTALCHDDYFEDTAGHCKSVAPGEDLTIEAILAHYGEIISSDADSPRRLHGPMLGHGMRSSPNEPPVSHSSLRITRWTMMVNPSVATPR